MRIALVAHIRHPIAAPFRGGMEAHAHSLAQALLARGHDVTVFAAGDSVLPEGVTLEPVVAEHYDRVYPWHDFHGTDVLNAHLDGAFARILPLLREGGFDVIHNNTLHRYIPRAARRYRLPMLTSLHVPPFDAMRRAVHESVASWSRVTACSQSHLDEWWPDGAPDTAHIVGNGIDLGKWPFVAEGDGSAVWAGRITPTKGTGDAVQAARRAGVPLRLFGPVEHRDYFEETVAPYLNDDIRYQGNLAQADLAAEVGRASVALQTPCWNEPFGLTAIEAMACGVPVAGYARGAIPEVVGDRGNLVTEGDIDGLALALRRAMQQDRRAVRQRVEQNFSLRRMLDGYEALYARVRETQAEPLPEVTFSERELPMHA